ncbi:hypothetical protein V8C34DRAFT_289799 [Trichoderma compactum]
MPIARINLFHVIFCFPLFLPSSFSPPPKVCAYTIRATSILSSIPHPHPCIFPVIFNPFFSSSHFSQAENRPLSTSVFPLPGLVTNDDRRSRKKKGTSHSGWSQISYSREEVKREWSALFDRANPPWRQLSPSSLHGMGCETSFGPFATLDNGVFCLVSLFVSRPAKTVLAQRPTGRSLPRTVTVLLLLRIYENWFISSQLLMLPTK